MAMQRKHTRVPRVPVEPYRREAYEQALEIRRVLDPDLSLADWVRQALDTQAEHDLGRPIHPPNRRRIVRRVKRP